MWSHCSGSRPSCQVARARVEAARSPAPPDVAVRNAVSLGGDTDTQACIAGGIAEAFYGPVGAEVVREVKERLTPDQWEVTQRFGER